MVCHPTTPAGGQLFINCIILYDFYAADIMDDDNFAPVLESFVIIVSTTSEQQEGTRAWQFGFRKQVGYFIIKST